MSQSDYDLIAGYAISLEHSAPAVAKMVLDEINRAAICSPGNLPPGVVTLGSEVVYRDEDNGAVRTVQLVLPGKADIDEGRISILTPMGAGLIGLSAGQTIEWRGLDGSPRILTILEVTQSP